MQTANEIAPDVSTTEKAAALKALWDVGDVGEALSILKITTAFGLHGADLDAQNAIGGAARLLESAHKAIHTLRFMYEGMESARNWPTSWGDS